MLKRLVAVRVALVMVLAFAVTTILPGLPAVAQPTIPAQLGDTAKLVAKGAAIEVPVIYTCPPGVPLPPLFVMVTERVDDDETAQGFGLGGSLTCDGAQHTNSVMVTSFNGNAFRKGVAVANGLFCDQSFNCVVALSDTIKVKK
jgi:hypothetical protein